MANIISFTAKDDYTLLLELDNQIKITYDMKPRLQAVRFCELTDINKFKAVSIENGNTLVWSSLCQITIDEIISIMERNSEWK